ncbi:hypothetical protein N0V90_001097 [Kalmusia sp. IMI 367209]|nr:hypothetical protein N0V90_001097 [Kalmusia sp. IMI 367209]
MLLPEGYLNRISRDFKDNTRPCIRCDSNDHGLADCTKKYDDCWKDTPRDFGDDKAKVKRLEKHLKTIPGLRAKRDIDGVRLTKDEQDKINKEKEYDEELEALRKKHQDPDLEGKRLEAEERLKRLKDGTDANPTPKAPIDPPTSAIENLGLDTADHSPSVSSRARKSNTANPPKTRTLIDTQNLGQVSTQEKKIPQMQSPNIDSAGIPNPKFQVNCLHEATKEETIEVLTNYLEVTKVPDQFHVYSFKFWRTNPPNSDITYNKRNEIIRAYEALKNHAAIHALVGGILWATDYKNLYAQSALPNTGDFGSQISTQPFPFIELNGTLVNIRATLTFTGILSNINTTLRNANVQHRTEAITALNAIIAQHVRSLRPSRDVTGPPTVTQVGANKFFRNEAFVEMRDVNATMPMGLRAVRGYYTSIRPGRSGLLLNVNKTTSAFLSPITVSDFLRQVRNEALAEKMLKGKTVRIKYVRQNTQEGANRGLDLNREEAREKVVQNFGYAAEIQKFYPTSGPGKTVYDYLTTDARVAPHDLPNNAFDRKCINVGKEVNHIETANVNVRDQCMREQSTGGAIWIPACLLEIIPNQKLSVQLDGASQLPALVPHSVHLPNPNVTYIWNEACLRLLGVDDPRGFWSHGSFSIQPRLVTLFAKKLRLPSLSFSNKAPQTPSDDRASWNLQHVTFRSQGFNTLKLNAFALRNSVTGKPLSDVLKMLREQAAAHGLKSGDGVAQTQNANQSLSAGLDAAYNALTRQDCLFVILNKDPHYMDNYAEIKRAADIRHGRHTLCALTNKVRHANPQFLSNLCLKIAMKKEVASHYLDATTLAREFGNVDVRNSTLILGADVTHPGASSKVGYPSVACVVGSVDNKFMNYPGSMRLQAGTQELINDNNMVSMVEERIRAWRAKNNDRAPKSILFYRDGISESQFDECNRTEVEAVRKAYKKICGDQALNLTFVIVGKRHHTRFYAMKKGDTYQCRDSSFRGPNPPRVLNGNLKAGLLVENVVTTPGQTNFYLQSHIAIKGTARSAHYTVLTDGMNLGPRLPKLTLMLCYTFPRATTGVSYVAPAYIADRLCERGRVYLRRWANNRDDRPHWQPISSRRPDGTARTKQEIVAIKTSMANELARSPVWNTNIIEMGPAQWLNPWHRNLDGTMFWM